MRPVFKADNASALVAAAVAGLGIAFIPDGVTNEHVASGALVPVMCRFPPPAAGIYVVRPAGQHPTAKIRVSRTFARKQRPASAPVRRRPGSCR
ncbi:LysR substrate-binding domain-containing protein [Caballeronia sp. LZ033]|uniref:LysR substrate-binding domain-containing protein n=1 Tax=Caballeronia sp. LZ033 TaxID=3038566 RepID=UPI0038D48E9A